MNIPRARSLSSTGLLVLGVLLAMNQSCSEPAGPGRQPATDAPTAPMSAAVAPGLPTAECGSPKSGWIFCDDFESDRTGKYYEYNNQNKTFVRTASAGYGGSVGMRATYTKGQSSAGWLSLAFGRTPDPYFRPVDAGTANYRELYWRFYLKREPGWIGQGPGKLTRATIFAKADWSQAMIAHAWTDDASPQYLLIDPASGTTTSGALATSGYNDFEHLRWLGSARSSDPEEGPSRVGVWECYEYHVKLNDAAQSNGVFEFFVDGQLSAQKTGLNWIGAYNAYGLNAILLENYTNDGAPAANQRTFDNFVVSTSRIGCGDQTTTPPTPILSSIIVTTDSASLTPPNVANANATLRDANGNPFTGSASIAWSSSNTAVATISSAGVITAISAGTTTITAKSGSISGSATLTVLAPKPAPVATVSVSVSASNVVVGNTTQAAAVLKDAGGKTLTGRSITWSSSDTSIATVSSTGLVSGIAPGAVTIAASSEGKSGQANVTVAPVPVSTVSVKLSLTSIQVGQASQVSATLKDASGNTLSGRTVTWRSSNTSVATVSSSGQVLGVKAGTASIIAASEGKTARATITVTAPVLASISLTLPSTSVQVGQTVQATATLLDAIGAVLTGRRVTWKSSNTAVATVSSTGQVKGVSAGTTTITATSGGKTAQAALRVIAVPVATVAITLSATSVQVGKTIQATAALKDSSGNTLTGRSVTWSSQNTKIATVSTAGVVTGVAPGATTIVATSETRTASASVTVQSLPAIQLSIVTQPAASATSGVVLSQQPVVQLQNASGAAVSQSGVVVTARVSNGSASLAGTTTATTNAAGRAAFTNLSIVGSAGSVTLGFSAGTLTAATSSTIALSAGTTTKPDSTPASSPSTGSSSTSQPFVVEDFSTYTSTANMLADPRGIYQRVEDIQTSRIALDTTVGYGSSKRSMRYDWPDRTSEGGSGTSGRCTDYTMSRSLKFPNNGAIQEVWVEVMVKTSANFTTQAPASWGCTSDQGYKFLDGNVDPGDRFSIGFRTGLTPPSSGQLWFGYPANVTDPQGKVNWAKTGNMADGNWHQYRCYWKISTGYPNAPNADGRITCWVDGVLVVDEPGIKTTSTAGNKPPRQFYVLSLGRNVNQGPDHAQSLWWGQVKIYQTNPGWQ